FAVRQVSFNASPGTHPEDTCLRARGGGASTGEVPRLTAAGARVFDRLVPSAQLPLGTVYLYRTRPATVPGCAVEPLLTVGDDVVAAVTRAPDGRERLAVTFTVGPGQPVEHLLGYGLVRWATHGVLLGEQRHWLTVDVDDWFNSN